MPTGRVLFIHAGGGKAGSSALQSALQIASSELAGLGINYANGPEMRSPYDVTSGNGFAFYEAMAAGRWLEEGASLLEAYMGGNPIGICSSEFLGSLSEGNWLRIVGTANAIGINIKAIYFVRSAAEYLLAAYNQDVKRAGESGSVTEFIKTTPWQNYLDLITLDKVIDEDSLRVFNYDRCRTDIIGAFVSSFEELRSAEGPLRRASGRKVNRSLIPAELEVMLKLNRIFGDRYSQSLSDRLIYSDPELAGRTSLPKEIFQIIVEKYADAAGWMNQKFLSDPDNRISVGEEPPCQEEHPGDRERALEIAFDWALSTLAQPPDEGMELRFVRERLLAIDWANADHPEIPIDFDPIAYLLLNEDVLRAGAGPFSHYVSSGKQEERPYCWPMPLIDPSADDTIMEFAAGLRVKGSSAGSGSPPAERLRRLYQTETLLHNIAIREREYLDQIRSMLEGREWERADFRQSFGELSEALGQQLSQIIRVQTEELIGQREIFANLNEKIRLREEALAAHSETLHKYREASVWRFLKWSMMRGVRP
jgi:hypothetical protein